MTYACNVILLLNSGGMSTVANINSGVQGTHSMLINVQTFPDYYAMCKLF